MTFSKTFVALAAFAAVSSASALTVTGATWGAGAPTGEDITLNGGGFVLPETNVGGFHVTASSEGSFYTVCVEVTQAFFPLPNTYTHEANGSANGFDVGTAARVAAVMQAAGFKSSDGGAVTTTQGFVALQMAVWNAVYDTDWTVSAGSFQQLTDTNGAKAGANALLAAASGIATPVYAVHKLYSADEQDVVISVPEPETYAMLLAGLGAVGFMARRRKQA
jgi:PEP-CTERM motif